MYRVQQQKVIHLSVFKDVKVSACGRKSFTNPRNQIIKWTKRKIELSNNTYHFNDSCIVFYLDFNEIQRQYVNAVFLMATNYFSLLITLNIFSKLQCETPQFLCHKNINRTLSCIETFQLEKSFCFVASQGPCCWNKRLMTIC